MSTRFFAVTSLIVAVMMGVVRAQQPAPATPAPGPSPRVIVDPPAPSSDQPNIQFDIAVADEGPGFPAVKKNIVLIIQGSGAGSLRSSGMGLMPALEKQSTFSFGRVPVEFNVDVKMPRYNPQEPNKIRARITIAYQPFSAEWKALPGSVRAQVDAMLENGRKMTLWQTTDPVTGLRTTIEVTATVLK